eukprot:364988-Chlamydomonas_euryale.AAC.28
MRSYEHCTTSTSPTTGHRHRPGRAVVRDREVEPATGSWSELCRVRPASRRLSRSNEAQGRRVAGSQDTTKLKAESLERPLKEPKEQTAMAQGRFALPTP